MSLETFEESGKQEGSADGIVVAKIRNGEISFFDSTGVQMTPEDVQAKGIAVPKINNGMVNLNGMSMTAADMEVELTKNGIKMIGQNISTGDFEINQTFGGGNRQSFTMENVSKSAGVSRGERLMGGVHTVDVGKTSELEKIMGGTVTLVGNGDIAVGKIMGGTVMIESGVVLVVEKLMGGTLDIKEGGFAHVDMILGGTVKGKSRLEYGKNMGGKII